MPMGYTPEEWAKAHNVTVDDVRTALSDGRLTPAMDGSIALHQQPIGISDADLARLRGVSREAVRKARRAGWLVVEADGTLNADASMRSWDASARMRQEGRSASAVGAAAEPDEQPRGRRRRASVASSSTPDSAADGDHRDKYQRWNAELVEQRARLARQRADEAAGLLLKADDVRDTVHTAYRALRDALLAIPDRMAGTIAGQLGVSDTRLVRDALHRTVVQALSDAEAAVNSIVAASPHADRRTQ